jgi:pimeloyl-ACP methyl ester carboxylesterase
VRTFTTYDGSELTYHVHGDGEPVIVIPGGPLRATRYLGNLGGLDAHRALVLLELPRRRVDQLVGDVEALRVLLRLEHLDVLAHSAGANLAELYAAAHPDRVARLALITPGTRAVGFPEDDDVWRTALRRREREPWFESAFAAVNAWNDGDDSAENRAAAMPLFYGRWDAAAQAHAAAASDEQDPDAGAIYYADAAVDPATTVAALAHLPAEVLVLVGGLDASPTVPEGEALVALFPKAGLVVQPRAGHYPWLDDAEAFTRTLAGFFS